MNTLIATGLWVHFISLAIAGVSVFGIPFVVAAMPALPAEARPVAGAVIMRMSKAGRVGVGGLIASGIFVFWARYNADASSLGLPFTLKMVLVLAAIGLIVVGVKNGKKALAGDAAARARGPKLSMLSMAVFALIVLCAVLTFG